MMSQAVIFFSDEIELKFQPDFSDAAAGEPGMVRIQVDGEDVENFGNDSPAVTVVGFFTPQHARDTAAALMQMAELAEAGAQ